MQTVSASLTWISDVKGNAPINLGTLLEGNRSMILAFDFDIGKSLGARVSYRSFLGKGNNADRFSDRDFVSFSLTRTFYQPASERTSSSRRSLRPVPFSLEPP